MSTSPPLTPTPRSIRGRCSRASLSIALVLGAMLAALVAPGAVAAPRPLSIEVEIGSGYIAGQVRDNAYVDVVVRDATGRLLGRGMADVYDGYWEFWNFPGAVYAGYRIKATSFNRNGTLETRKLTVPSLSIGIDRTTNVVSGKGPAGKTVQVGVADGRWEYWGESYEIAQDVPVDGGGRYSFDFTTLGIDVRGGASASVRWANAANTVSVSKYAETPRIMFGIDYPDFWGVTRRNVHVEATLKDGSNVVAVGHAVGYGSGYFDGIFTDADEEDFPVQGGLWFTAPAIANDVDWQIPTGVSGFNASTDQISGNCFPNGRYQVYAFDQATYEEAWGYGEATASGALTFDMTPVFNLRSNSYVELLCWTPEADYVWDGFGKLPDWWSANQSINDDREQ